MLELQTSFVKAFIQFPVLAYSIVHLACHTDSGAREVWLCGGAGVSDCHLVFVSRSDFVVVGNILDTLPIG